MLGQKKHYSPSPLGEFNRLFEGLIGVLLISWHFNMIYFLNGINLAKNVNMNHWFAGKSKLNAVSTSESKSKQTWFPCCLMPTGTIQHLNTRSTVLTNITIPVASLVHGEWRWQLQQNLLNSFLSLVCLLVTLNAEVLVVVVVLVCVQGSGSQVSTFSCYPLCLPLTQNANASYPGLGSRNPHS